MTRLCGPTSSVTVEFIFETLVYINNNAVVDAFFIEENYLSVIFDDDEFLTQCRISICSVQFLLNKYEEARRVNDEAFLLRLSQKHREARAFLDNNEIKEGIKAVIENRKEVMENRAIWATITNILGLLQHFPRTALGRLLAPIVPQLTQTVPQLTNTTTGDGNLPLATRK